MNVYWEPEGYYQLGEGDYTEITAREVLQRLNAATGTQGQLALANWLGARQSSLSDAIRRNIIPASWLQLLLIKQTGYNPVWVLTGKGEAYSGEWRLTLAGLRGALPGRKLQ